MNKFRMIALFSILCLFIAIPTGFAMDNDTVIIADKDTSHDYYFDSSVENDGGNGSVDNPFKNLKSNRIKDNSNIYLANGRYNLDYISYPSNVNIYGNDSEKTVIYYYGSGFRLEGPLTLNNVTLLYCGIQNQGHDFTANNVIFDSYSSSYSSSVMISGDSNNVLNNCTFKKTSGSSGGAVNIDRGSLVINSSSFENCKASSSGGAIYMTNSNLFVHDSLFANNTATLWGGAISCDDKNDVIITNTKFVGDCSISDAGGAIYVFNSTLNAADMEISNCSAEFGGAITSLSSKLTLINFTSQNNNAKYYGGSIYAFYRNFLILNSTLTNNSALIGGALFVDGVEDFQIYQNRFINNSAKNGGAIYSIYSDFYYDSFYDAELKNTFVNNNAVSTDLFNLTVSNNNYLIFKTNSSFNGILPKSYDLRQLGQVTSAKDQGNGGNCWAFSALAALESSILKSTVQYYDFSEENIKNLMSLYSAYGWSMDTNGGGYDDMAIGYFTGWLGPVNESDDKYNAKSKLSPLLDSILHIQNVVFLTRDSYTDNDAIKKAIMDYGAVSTSVCWESTYINGKNYYCYKDSARLNHAVAIVGWDDNYSKDNFKHTPEGDGAWIIKNSWGTSGDKGFYYVSYYDTKFALPGQYNSYVFILNNTMRYDKNYQYDIQGRTDYFLNSTNTVWYKNKFTATDKEYLAAVSTYFDKDTHWDLSVLVNNKLKLTQSGFSTVSYSTINLNELIPLNVGDIFEIIFKITVDGDAGVPISEIYSLNHKTYSEGISFISYDGKNWDDLYELEWQYPDHIYESQVACIKAFTVLNKVDTKVILEVADSYNPVEITAHVLNQYGGAVNSGTVTFNLASEKINVKVANGIAKVRYAFANNLNNLITAVFNGVGYNSNQSSIEVKAKEVNIIANDLTTYIGDNSYNVILLDGHNNPVSGKEIIFNINNMNYIASTNNDGVAAINFKLNDVGKYTIKIGLNDDSANKNFILTKEITAISTITLPPAKKYTLNSKYIATLLDNQGKPLENAEVSIIVNSKTYDLTTDEKGIINYNINLKPGSYQISIINNVTGEVKTQTINVAARLNSNKDVTMYFGAGTYYKVRAYDDNGNIAKNVKVVININGKNYSKYTDKNGYASLKIYEAPKTYTITATYKGFKVSNKVVIKPTLILSTKTVKKSKTFKYTVKLLDSKGKILKYKKVTVKFRGKTYTAKTNSKGIATFYVKSLSKTGKYTLTAIYGNAKIGKTITIKK